MSADPVEKAEDYMNAHGLKELIQSLTTGLVYHQPASPLDFLLESLRELKLSGVATTQVTWDHFIGRNNNNLGNRGIEARGTMSKVSVERKNIDIQPIKDANVPIIFVIGGPGSGKGTQCELIVSKYGYSHFSTGDLLRDEVQSGSARGRQLNDVMERGELVPLDVVLDLLKEAMVKAAPTSKGFLIDGFPREIAQGQEFEKQICDASCVLYFDVAADTMKARLLSRAQTSGRVDDNETTIAKRIDTFYRCSEPVVRHYHGKCANIKSEGSKQEIFVSVCDVLDKLNN